MKGKIMSKTLWCISVDSRGVHAYEYVASYDEHSNMFISDSPVRKIHISLEEINNFNRGTNSLYSWSKKEGIRRLRTYYKEKHQTYAILAREAKEKVAFLEAELC